MTSDRRNPLLSHDGVDTARSAARRVRDSQTSSSNRRLVEPELALQSEVAGYIEVLAAEMRMMAHAADLDSLAYFLEMARLEAAIQVQRLARNGSDPGR